MEGFDPFGLAIFWFGFGFSAGVVSVLSLRVLGVWVSAVASGVQLPLSRLVGMRLRRCPVQLIVDAHIALSKRGHTVSFDVVEVAYLGHRSNIRDEQDLVSLVEGVLAKGEEA